MRPFSTLGWFMLEAIGALHLDQTKDVVLQAWILDTEERKAS